VTGILLHLVAIAHDRACAEVAKARRLLGWGLVFAGLGRGTPDPSEVELRDERDQARAENYSIRLRVCDAHAAVYRAMRATPAEALAALGDEGYVHLAVHAVLCGPDGTAAYPIEEALRLHIEALGARALRAEGERDEAQVQLAELREAARALLGAGDDPDPDCDCEVCVALRRLRALAGEGELSR